MDDYKNMSLLDMQKKYPATLKRAKEIGSMYYFTGIPCTHGHAVLRYTSSANCVECVEIKRGFLLKNKRGKKTVRSTFDQELALKANAEGLTTYESLFPCKYGHKIKFVSTNNCVECDKAVRLKRKELSRWRRIKKEYNLARDEFYAILEIQKHLCPICGNDISEQDKNIHIDHNHDTGIVRGILCSKCNQGIGLFMENKNILKSAIAYLEEHE